MATNKSVPARQEYSLQAYSVPERFNLKKIKLRLPEEFTEQFDQDCLIFHKEFSEKIFIFRFGTVVFFNIAKDDHSHFLSQIGVAPHDKVTDPEEDEFSIENFNLRVEPEIFDVGFNYVTLPKLDVGAIQLIALVLAQSSALEILESEVEDLLQESDKMTNALKRKGWFRGTRQELLKFLGEGLNARHRVVNQLALFDDPEKTWEKEDLYKIYLKLFDGFDIEERIERIDRMLKIYSDSAALMLELTNTRRAEILELTIIALIAFEIIQALVK